MQECRRRSTSSSDCAASDKRRRRNGSARRLAAAVRASAGMRSAADRSIVRSLWTLVEMWRRSADPNLAVGDELIGRQRQIGRRRPAADTAGCIVLRAVARTEITVVVGLVRDRDAAEMRAYA